MYIPSASSRRARSPFMREPCFREKDATAAAEAIHKIADIFNEEPCTLCFEPMGAMAKKNKKIGTSTKPHIYV